MAGTRKLEKFNLGRQSAFESGTRRLEKFDLPAMRPPIVTPVAEMAPGVLAAARRTIPPEPTVEIDEPTPPPPSARTIDREPCVEQLRTRLARKFTTLADRVTESFSDFRIGAGAWAVELTAPDGMSTSGGTQALQHLRLRPTRQGHSVLVGGVVNAMAKTAELRDYDHMAITHSARFGRTLEITSDEWEQFLRKAEVVLHQEKMSTARVSAPGDVLVLAGRARGARAWNQRAAAVTLGVVVFLATIVAWRVVLVLWP